MTHQLRTIQCLTNECEYCFEVFVGGWFRCTCACHREPEPIFGIWPPIIIYPLD